MTQFTSLENEHIILQKSWHTVLRKAGQMFSFRLSFIKKMINGLPWWHSG